MLYSASHDAGVIHNDVSRRHLLRRGHNLRVIDFERAIGRKAVCDEDEDNQWKEACDNEMWILDALLREV